MAKDFKAGAQKASEAGRISATIKERTAPTEKPAKLPRVNLALTPEAFDFIKTVSKASGQTQGDGTRGKRLGTAYQLEDGRIIYVPE